MPKNKPSYKSFKTCLSSDGNYTKMGFYDFASDNLTWFNLEKWPGMGLHSCMLQQDRLHENLFHATVFEIKAFLSAAANSMLPAISVLAPPSQFIPAATTGSDCINDSYYSTLQSMLIRYKIQL